MKTEDWISVKDRLPERTEPLIGYNDENVREVMIANFEATVLAYHPEIGICKARLQKFGWSEVSSISVRSFEPTHWMPLPEPPQP